MSWAGAGKSWTGLLFFYCVMHGLDDDGSRFFSFVLFLCRHRFSRTTFDSELSSIFDIFSRVYFIYKL